MCVCVYMYVCMCVCVDRYPMRTASNFRWMSSRSPRRSAGCSRRVNPNPKTELGGPYTHIHTYIDDIDRYIPMRTASNFRWMSSRSPRRSAGCSRRAARASGFMAKSEVVSWANWSSEYWVAHDEEKRYE